MQVCGLLEDDDELHKQQEHAVQLDWQVLEPRDTCMAFIVLSSGS